MEIREWSLNWAQGCVIGYIKGTLEEKRAVGMLKRAMDWGVKKEELKNILDSVKISPLYLPSFGTEYKAKKISELEKLLELK